MSKEKSIKLTLNEKDGTVEMDVKGMNPIEVAKICTGMVATALNKITPSEKSAFQKPSDQDIAEIKKIIQ